MKLLGENDPNGGSGYVPGAWDQVRAEYMAGHITEEAYEILHRVVVGKRVEDALLRQLHELAVAFGGADVLFKAVVEEWDFSTSDFTKIKHPRFSLLIWNK